jgi:hypothetical protein
MSYILSHTYITFVYIYSNTFTVMSKRKFQEYSSPKKSKKTSEIKTDDSIDMCIKDVCDYLPTSFADKNILDQRNVYAVVATKDGSVVHGFLVLNNAQARTYSPELIADSVLTMTGKSHCVLLTNMICVPNHTSTEHYASDLVYTHTHYRWYHASDPVWPHHQLRKQQPHLHPNQKRALVGLPLGAPPSGTGAYTGDVRRTQGEGGLPPLLLPHLEDHSARLSHCLRYSLQLGQGDYHPVRSRRSQPDWIPRRGHGPLLQSGLQPARRKARPQIWQPFSHVQDRRGKSTFTTPFNPHYSSMCALPKTTVVCL